MFGDCCNENNCIKVYNETENKSREILGIQNITIQEKFRERKM